jgi:raffinose/stachyose/melibiose transport system substrate-binding protein
VKTSKGRIRGLITPIVAAVAIAVPAIVAVPAHAAVTLSFWSWRPEDTAFWTQETAAFQAQTGITVKYTPYDATQYNADLATALTAGSGPDIMQIRSYGGMANLSDAGDFLPLTPATVPALAKIPAGTLAGAQGYTVKKQFGLPYSTSVLGVMYNPVLLSQAGISALPSTWSSFLADLQKIKSAGITPLGNGLAYGPGLEQLWGAIAPTFYGGNQFFNSIVAGKQTFTDPGIIASLNAEKSLVPFMPANADGLGYNDARALFANGKAAFYIGGSYEISYFQSLNPSIQVGWMPGPAANAGAPRYVTNWADGAFAINAKTTHQKEALEFLNFIASKSTMQAAADQLGWIPPFTGIHSDNPAIISMSRAIPSQGTPFLTLVGFRYGTPTSSSILQAEAQSTFDGKQTTTKLAQDIEAAVASWYAPLKGKA